MKKLLAAVSLTAMVVAVPVKAAETISVDFTVPDGGVTAGLYSGMVQVHVEGIGQSLGAQFNDAFYLLPGGVNDASYYQLAFGLAPLVPLNPAQIARNFIVGGLPAFNPANVYDFVLNTGAVAPTMLHFGVSDGIFSDNSGAYQVTVTQLGGVPEPATWALMLLGFGLLGTALRRRRISIAYA